MENVKILCVDDEKNVLRALQRLFMDEEYEILTAASGEEGLEICEQQAGIQLIISDYRMPGMDGIDFLKIVNAKWPNTIRIVLSGFADTASVVGAINEGQIYKFIPKPWNDDDLKCTVDKALESYFLRQQNEQLHAELLVSNEMLKNINEKLEELVERKTEELIFQNRTLQLSQNILHALPVAVIGLDESGLIVQVNALAAAIFKDAGATIVNMRAEAALPREVYELVGRAGESGAAHGVCVLAAQPYSVRVQKFEVGREQRGILLLCIPAEKES